MAEQYKNNKENRRWDGYTIMRMMHPVHGKTAIQPFYGIAFYAKMARMKFVKEQKGE